MDVQANAALRQAAFWPAPWAKRPPWQAFGCDQLSPW